MTNTKSPTTPPATAGGALQAREEAAREYTGKQEHSKSWKPLTNSSPVSFMALRTGMCRWPIGDPHQFETFRFCGCKCSVEAIYCTTHKKLASAPSRARIAPASRSLQLSSPKVA